MRLANATLAQLSAEIACPDYARDEQQVGIAHLGIGAFHRAHQAVYTDRAMGAGARDWGILGVSLRSPEVAERLNPQDGWYLVNERSDRGGRIQLVGAVQRVLVGPSDATTVEQALAASTTHIVSFTITEKGYCRLPDGSLDLELARRSGLYPLLLAAFRARRKLSRPGFTLLCCDNLPANGRVLQALMEQFLAAEAPEMLSWFREECACPSTMVDRIVPATTPADIAAVLEMAGLEDQGLVVTEEFSQWVIEDRFAGPRPPWEKVGAQLVTDVHAYETAKLRLLNGAHSALAYLGLARGYRFVHEAVADPVLRNTVESLMKNEAASSVAAAPGMDLRSYADALLARFANPSLNHRLEQIAMDGSQKLPQRWLQTLAFHQAAGRECPALLRALGAWLLHIRGDARVVEDPLAAALKKVWDAAGTDTIVPALFGHGGLMASDWLPTPSEAAAIQQVILAEGRV